MTEPKKSTELKKERKGDSASGNRSKSQGKPSKSNSGKCINFTSLVKRSEKFQALKEDLRMATKLSLTGITNLVVNHEDPALVDAFLKDCFKRQELYNNTQDIDAVELQHGFPGKMNGYKYLDELIYGGFEMDSDPDLDIPIPKTDPATGKRKRKSNGFVNRKQVLTGEFKDRLLIIKNVDFCLDFCFRDSPGVIDPKSLDLFNNFRDPTIKRGCRILLISNVKVQFPFEIRKLEISSIDSFEANHIVDSFLDLYVGAGYSVEITDKDRDQIIHKLSGLTYTEAGDALACSFSSNANAKKMNIDIIGTLKSLRKFINQKFMEKGFGLEQLTSRPWEDYICPDSSHFTWDVEKMLRDFNHIESLRLDLEKEKNKKQYDKTFDLINSIQTRMPHVIVLYGKGGVGKSAFPIHFAGLLGFDVWDFNVNAVHSKWVGQGSEQARKAIDAIMNCSHVIVRIDEYDRVIGATNDSAEGMHEAHKQVESEFMSWLQNGQEENEFVKKNIFVVLTTNHKDSITGPMLRSGRVDLVMDIDNFDSESMEKAILTTSQRMKTREIKALGYENYDELQDSIEKLDISKIAELCTIKGFTVRDVETLILEMSSHHYYHKIGQKGMEWNDENFLGVLEYSEGSMKEDDSTGELVLGDRDWFYKINGEENKSSDQQMDLSFEEKKGFREC